MEKIPQICGFDWDSGNSAKILSRQGISKVAIEEFFSGTVFVGPDIKHSIGEDRYVAVGRSRSGRAMFVVFAFRSKNGELFIRPISARFMHAREVKRYEQEFAKNQV